MAVIELLRVTCVPGRRNEWLARDAAIWTPALARHEGFISKEVWPSLTDPDQVAIVVRWASQAQWKSFPEELGSELVARMREVQLGIVCEEYEVYAG